MALEVDYLPIANGAGANVESQSQYVTDLGAGGSLVNGYQSGLAKSTQVNKTLRQASMIAAAVANVIANQLQVNVLDDGNLSTLIANLTNAFGARTKLTSALTLYVNGSTGSDSNNGLTSGSAFATIQHAINVLQQNYDLNGQAVTISIADGTYAPVYISGPFIGDNRPSADTNTSPLVTLSGDTTTPTNCSIASTTSASALTVVHGARINIQGFSLSSTSGNGIYAAYGSLVFLTGAVNFGACSGTQTSQIAAFDSATVRILANFTVSAGAPSFVHVGYSGCVEAIGITGTFNGTPAYSFYTAYADTLGMIAFNGCTLSGSATGTRYAISSNAVADTYGAGANFFPGSVAGTTSTGGQYI